MAEVLLQKSQRRMRQHMPVGAGEAFVSLFEDYCLQNCISRPKAAAWARFLRGELTVGVIPLPAMTLEDSTELEVFLRDFCQSDQQTSEQGGTCDAEESV